MKYSRLLICVLTGCLLLFVNCDECTCDQGPFFADLELKVTVNDENRNVPIEIYEGTYDEGFLIIQDTVSSTDLINGRMIYDLEAGLFYAAAAIYQDGAKTIIAIDGAEIQIRTDDCDCEFADNRTLNLRLAK